MTNSGGLDLLGFFKIVLKGGGIIFRRGKTQKVEVPHIGGEGEVL